mmetsp:Transcript_22379/g.28966  ORF Transcript_22379/g.28966 Transcript_22379/m.28966 type:complete len:508 (-) Transcript_22379:198-1721(-)|eukprot:CAMPEP_0197293952 /NCGR_PEP_ID=MMETSP0890-20130614/30519_1 /TAXON_ID=44058 ORGANISM="Aureoumbra lagunensis, Strain CCMP1510" /NCGR_SAMPLE_ID=MMETSP0890 /ASSEMBLY_ACC=CAM_ASM_000533 /LENGTH=507 /DNA_ID=CAMNT_0042769051 /DNA_START=32 /DNA_END=1555 /DNA_ORIENTATION=+
METEIETEDSLHERYEGETEVCCPSPHALLLCFPKFTRTSFVVGCANVAGQMNYNSIVLALLMLQKSGDVVPAWATAASSSVLFLGSIVGQVVLGFLGDTIGRIMGLVFSLILMTVGALASALAWDGLAETRTIVYITIIVARFVAGIGVGGSYPLSAVAAFENKTSQGGRTAALVRASWGLFWQVPGQITIYVLAGILAVIPLSWTLRARLLLASGALPALAALPFALELAGRDKPLSVNKRTQLKALFSMPTALRYRLIGASLSWFLFDLYAYGVTVYSADIAEWIFNGNLSISENAWYNALGSAVGLGPVLASIYLLSATKGDVGRLQTLGFSTAAAFFCATGAAWLAGTSSNGLAIIFLALRAAIVFGTAVTTFIAPASLFPPRLRASCNGVAAAIGKVGGLVGTYGFILVADATGAPALFFILAFVATMGVFVTIFLLPCAFGPADDENNNMPIGQDAYFKYSEDDDSNCISGMVPHERSHLLNNNDNNSSSGGCEDKSNNV